MTHSQARATHVAFDRPTNLDDAQARTARTNMRVREDFVSFRETQELDEEAAARARLNLRVQGQLINYREAQELTVEQRTLVRNTLHITNNRVVLGSPGEGAPPRRTRAVAGPQGQRDEAPSLFIRTIGIFPRNPCTSRGRSIIVSCSRATQAWPSMSAGCALLRPAFVNWSSSFPT